MSGFQPCFASVALNPALRAGLGCGRAVGAKQKQANRLKEILYLVASIGRYSLEAGADREPEGLAGLAEDVAIVL